MDLHDDDGKIQYVRGVNWAPDSDDEDEESEVQFVLGQPEQMQDHSQQCGF